MPMFCHTVQIKSKLHQVTAQRKVNFKSYTRVQRAYFNTTKRHKLSLTLIKH
jgi:hypothetical protein